MIAIAVTATCARNRAETRPSTCNQNPAVFSTFQKTGMGAIGAPTTLFPAG
jgi:hypothetical protein